MTGGAPHRFCTGCKLYHTLSCFENGDVDVDTGAGTGKGGKKGAKKPGKVCMWFKERRKQRKLEADAKKNGAAAVAAEEAGEAGEV